jgi:hypothetical protein
MDLDKPAPRPEWTVVALRPQARENEPNMMLAEVDYHPSFQTIAF